MSWVLRNRSTRRRRLRRKSNCYYAEFVYCFTLCFQQTRPQMVPNVVSETLHTTHRHVAIGLHLGFAEERDKLVLNNGIVTAGTNRNDAEKILLTDSSLLLTHLTDTERLRQKRLQNPLYLTPRHFKRVKILRNFLLLSLPLPQNCSLTRHGQRHVELVQLVKTSQSFLHRTRKLRVLLLPRRRSFHSAQQIALVTLLNLVADVLDDLVCNVQSVETRSFHHGDNSRIVRNTDHGRGKVAAAHTVEENQPRLPRHVPLERSRFFQQHVADTL